MKTGKYRAVSYLISLRHKNIAYLGGPDEYRERVNDNASTNCMAFHAVSYSLSILKKKAIFPQKQLAYQDFLAKMYLPKPNKNGVIEQFAGHFEKRGLLSRNGEKSLEEP